ncbi:hypothetical protein ACHAWF_008989, partial [Thalassiosira exigua]
MEFLDRPPPYRGSDLDDGEPSDGLKHSCYFNMHHGPHQLRRDSPADANYTETTTMLSGSGTSLPAHLCGGSPETPSEGSAAAGQVKKKKKKKRGLSRLVRLPSILQRRPKRLTEAQLRKRLRKYAERGDWDVVRKLLANHEFSSLPEVPPRATDVIPEEPPATARETSKGKGSAAKRPSATKRPSYGSRNGERRSFTGSFTGESAAAAALIRDAQAVAALELEEEGSSRQNDQESGQPSSGGRPDVGENVLHDVCRHMPPLDVIETLLAALRHRRGCTYGTDEEGRTPLHLAADSGAPPEIIGALVRADPSPASMGDCSRCSPLHLTIKYFVYGGYDPPLMHGRNSKNKTQNHEVVSPQKAFERTLEIARILKEAMLTYPGRIDFKDEDSSGFSPLDYVIDGDVQNESLIHLLLRRREPTRRRRVTSRRLRGPGAFPGSSSCNRSRCGSAASSVTEDHDFDVLEQLEREEIEARRHRIEKIAEKRRNERREEALFDVFGIDECPAEALLPDEGELDGEPIPPFEAPQSTDSEQR